MSDSTGKFGILVGVDGSTVSNAALRWVAVEAALHDAPITLVHVVMPVVVSPRDRRLQTRIDSWQKYQRCILGGAEEVSTRIDPRITVDVPV